MLFGTATIENPEFLRGEALAQHKEKSPSALIARTRHGLRSWLGSCRKSELQYIDFAIQMEAMGVKTIVVTDISRDGTMTGPNTKMLAGVKENGFDRYYSFRGYS